MSDTLIKVESVSKKFCRGLKRSLWYGMQDLGNELAGYRRGGGGDLRPEEFWAVKDVSFEVRRGECLGLIGHNGAGKTTLLRILNGLITPDAGRIEIRGRVGALIALGAGFNPILTGRENIYVNATVLGLTKPEIDSKLDEIVDFAELREFIDSPVQNYSSGMVVRLGFAIAAKTEPDVLLLDEVLAVGDVAFQAKCFNVLSEFRDRGTAFILVSHNMHQISRYANQVLYLKKGMVASKGDSDRCVCDYLKDMRLVTPALGPENTDWSRVNGSGKITLTGCRFFDKAGSRVTEINVSDDVILEIDYVRREALDEPLLIDVLIRDQEGVVFHGTSDNRDTKLNSLRDSGNFRVFFGEFPLNVDYLDFYIAVLNPINAEIYDWKRDIRLLVRRVSSQQGKLDLRVRWKIT